jgi:peptidoglycan/LPS O-acetylase OafA/YrhL
VSLDASEAQSLHIDGARWTALDVVMDAPHRAPTEKSDYRRDIDGLRAVAVLAVVIHHLAPAALPAGFIGVDIFFVISGFLITRIVWMEASAGRFSYLAFYRRRCIRILPALIVVLAACLVIGALVLTGPEFQALGKHILSASAFVSNIVLWREAGYFDTVSIHKPLLHLWSLAIEEQFYLVWPALMVLVVRYPVGARRGLIGLGLLSLLISVAFARWAPSAGFYLLPARVWELMAPSPSSLPRPAPRRTLGS